MDEALRERIRTSFDMQNMMTTLGAELVEVEPGMVRVAAPILPGSRQQHGFGHAALTFALGDTAAGYAALSTMTAESEVLTSEIKINLLAPARGDRLVATGRVVKSGKWLCIVTAEVHAEEDGKAILIAILQGTMVPVSG